MAVTLTVQELAAALRIAGSGTTLGDTLAGIVGRLLGTATAMVLEYAPDADNEDVQNEAVIRIAAYLHDNDAARNRRFSDVLALSGAASILSIFRVQRALAIDGTGVTAIGTTPGGGVSVERVMELIAEALAGFTPGAVGGGGVFDGERLPGADVAMRMGWTVATADPDAMTFLRSGNHPDDGATEGTTAGLLTPPIPLSAYNLTMGSQYRFHIWIAGAVGLAALVGPYGDNWLPEFPTSTMLEVDGVVGIVYSEHNTRHDTDGLYSFSGVIPGELIASQPWVMEQIAAI